METSVMLSSNQSLPSFISRPVDALLEIILSLVVTLKAVLRAELLQLRRDHDELFRVRGKFEAKQLHCKVIVGYTDDIIRGVLFKTT